MTFEDTRDAIIAIVQEMAPDSPAYLHNGGPENVAGAILEKLGAQVQFDAPERPYADVWVLTVRDDEDEAWRIVRTYWSEADAVRDQRAFQAENKIQVKEGLFNAVEYELSVFKVEGDILNGEVYGLVEIDNTYHTIDLVGVYVSEYEAKKAMADLQRNNAVQEVVSSLDFNVETLSIRGWA